LLSTTGKSNLIQSKMSQISILIDPDKSNETKGFRSFN
jgi:hypothetical protein